jgi:hypothetical protein
MKLDHFKVLSRYRYSSGESEEEHGNPSFPFLSQMHTSRIQIREIIEAQRSI